jgi:hypothetical protein
MSARRKAIPHSEDYFAIRRHLAEMRREAQETLREISRADLGPEDSEERENLHRLVGQIRARLDAITTAIRRA